MPIYKTYSCLFCGKLREKVPNNKGMYCSNICSGAARKKKSINDWLLDGKKPNRVTVKRWLTEKFGYKCNCCGISEWQNKPITLWVDHIDGNAANNSPTNFQLMCPNCDSQQDTFGAKNYGKGRKSRGLKQYG